MKTHFLLKIVPAVLLFGTVAIAQVPPSGTSNAGLQQQVEQILSAGNKDATAIAQLTAEAAAKNPKNAAALVAAVEKATGISGETLAAAIGRQFQTNPDLANQAPSIAKELVIAILAKGSESQPQIQSEIAETVAILVTSLPGKAQANQQTITQVGREVASVLSASHPEVAAEVVGITATVLKTTSGTSDVSSVISSFADSFKTDNTSLNSKLDNIVTNVNSGQSYNALPTTTNVINNTNGNNVNSPTNGLSSGAVTNPETNNQNK